ncbi:MAG: hypothetical protein QW273_02985 [Candidatus Pacearchaeota archaeon]
MQLEEGSLVLCFVEKIEKEIVLVRTEDGTKGTIVSSEIAPGRIKNIREYVYPNKVIVCKVLEVFPTHLNLSLRRVNQKEKKEVLERYEREKTFERVIKSLLKEKAEEVLKKIKETFGSYSTFIDKVREKEELLEEYLPKEHKEVVKKVIEKRKKGIEIKKIIKITSFSSDGIKRIKEVLNIDNPKIEIKYIAAGNFLLTFRDSEQKKVNSILQEIIDNMEKKAKKLSCTFSVEEKK